METLILPKIGDNKFYRTMLKALNGETKRDKKLRLECYYWLGQLTFYEYQVLAKSYL
jgi:hypothetical protein